MNINEMIRKWRLVLTEKDGKKGLRVLRKISPTELTMIREKKDEIIAELEHQRAEKEAIEAQKKADREEEIRAIKAGEKTITVKWTDGEYLQAYQVSGIAAELLEELGIAKYIDGWGVRVEQDLVKALGEEFTYQQVVDFTQPKRDREVEKEVQKKAELNAKFEEAKRTGKPVEIFRTTTECNDPKIECSLDIITIWAMPDGTQKEERIHTY
jgi:hypothetical protein